MPAQPIAIFGDIHANLPALEAVLEDMDSIGIEKRYCLGDLVGYATQPNEVIARIRRAAIPTIQGNYDQGVGQSSDDCGCAYRTEQDRELGKRSIAWSNEHTTTENKRYLQGLPDSLPLQLGPFRLLLVHGSPRRINEYLYEDRPDRSIERLLDLAEVEVLVCGHTHLPYHKNMPSGRHVINAGSVGKPKDGNPHAGYVVLAVEEGRLQVQFVRVPYNLEDAVRGIEASTMPDEFVALLRSGSG